MLRESYSTPVKSWGPYYATTYYKGGWGPGVVISHIGEEGKGAQPRLFFVVLAGAGGAATWAG